MTLILPIRNEADYQALIKIPNRPHLSYPNLKLFYQRTSSLWKTFRRIARAV